jgi:GNAT superfamily N-acetyltransferase
MLLIETHRTYKLATHIRQEVLEMCNAAFGIPFDALFEMLPPDGLHVIGRLDDDKLVAHLVITDRYLRTEGHPHFRTAYFDAVATHPDFRKRGYAGALINKALEICSGRYDLLALATNEPTLYSKHGCVKWQGMQINETEDGKGVENSAEQNNLMILPCDVSLKLDLSKPMTANWRPGGGW